MDIEEATNKEQYNQFILENQGPLEQSWQWGELQEREGRQVKRFLAVDEGKPQRVASFVRYDLPLGKYYWLCPRGPVILEGAQATDRILRDSIASFQNDEGTIFVRVEPQVEVANSELRTPNFWTRAPKDHSPKATSLVDLTNPEDVLLKEMHSKTRYNVRLAARKGVRVKSYESRVKSEDFFELLKRTAQRDGFHLHPDEHYKKLLELPGIELFLAYYKDKAVAGAVISFFGDKATYLHGASDYHHRQLMAPYLLHWEVIKEAKKRGLKRYDFGGVSPNSAKNHPWVGITRFKKGFGGEYVEYAGTFDYVLNKFWYSMYKIGRKVL